MNTNFSKFASQSTENTNSTNHMLWNFVIMFTIFLGGVSVQIGPLHKGGGQTGPLGNVDGFL